ncbi:MAG: response regulator [Patescibacteria group bacterium]
MKKILLAVSDKAYSRALSLKLQNAKYEVLTVPNGEEALLEIWRNEFDLLLCDLVMPKTNGFEVLEELKKQDKKIPVIILMNIFQEEDEKKVKDLGALDVFIKADVTILEIINKIKEILN